MSGLLKAKVLMAVPHMEQVLALAPHLPQAELYYAPDSDALLKAVYSSVPDVVVLSTRLPTLVALPEVMALMRSRPEMAATFFVVLGDKGVLELVQVGGDMVVLSSVPPAVMAQQIDSALRRSREVRALQERAQLLSRRLEEWEHEERVRDQLIHMLVHDLKNPITAILGLLDLVRTDLRLPQDLADMVKLSREEAQHLLHLSVNMLDVRKIQAGKMNLNPVLLFAPMLEETIAQASGDVGSGLDERHLRIDVPPGLTPIQADPEILRRIFANLLSNALKHTRAGGNIGVKVRELTDDLEFSVSDDGEGIPAEDIPNLFAAFEQSRLTLHGRFDTGMGLAFCKLAVEGHGGRIWVESQRGVGSTFFFTLPLDQPEEDEAELIF